LGWAKAEWLLFESGCGVMDAKLSPYVIAMEACCGAHHMGRSSAALGHEVRLMSPEYVRPCVKAQKNDDRDAETIAEAATRPRHAFCRT
jgi:transposase